RGVPCDAPRRGAVPARDRREGRVTRGRVARRARPARRGASRLEPGPRRDLVVELLEVERARRDVELPERALAALSPEPLCEVPVAQEPLEVRREPLDVTLGREQSRATVRERLGNTTVRVCDSGRAERRRLEEHHAEALG